MRIRGSDDGRAGFTLVELLVVIGIIALLIGILLPSLNKSRQQANDLACQANLRSIGQALGIYAAEHRGWWPKPGGQLVIGGVSQPSGTAPRDVWSRAVFPALYKTAPDPNGTDTRYTYLQRTVFTCPSAVTTWDGVTASDISYGMSAQLTAIRNGPANSGGRNNYKKVTKLRKPAETAAIVDTNMPWAGTFVNPTSQFANAETWQITWYDQSLHLQKAAKVRHRNKINVLWVDGHVTPVPYAQIPQPPEPRDSTTLSVASPLYYRFWSGTE